MNIFAGGVFVPGKTVSRGPHSSPPELLQDHKGGGIVHFRTWDDMDYALRKLDGSDFRNPFEKSRISVSVDGIPMQLVRVDSCWRNVPRAHFCRLGDGV